MMRNPETSSEPLPRRSAAARKRFAGRSDQVAAARGFVLGMVGQGSDLGETARLLVSEAATNAVLHSASGEAGGSFEVRCRLARARLRVEIHDAGAPQSPPGAGQRPLHPLGLEWRRRWPGALVRAGGELSRPACRAHGGVASIS